MPARLRLSPNIPVICQLLDPVGDYDFELQRGQYEAMDAEGFKVLVLPRPAVIVLNLLDPRPGEEIGICHYVIPGQSSRWSVWLTPRSEKARAAEKSQIPEAQEPSDLAGLLQASIDRYKAAEPVKTPPTLIRKPIQPETLGTGTDGPVPALAAALSALPKPVAPWDDRGHSLAPAPALRPPSQTEYAVALKEIVETTVSILNACGEQWSDAAKQDLVSTLFIQAAKTKCISFRFSAGEKQ